MKIKFLAIFDKSNLLSPTLFERLKPTLILALLWNNFYSDSFLLSVEAKCLFYRFKQLCNNIPFCKIDIIRTKIKNVISYHIYTSIHIFINELYTKFYSNNNSWRNKKTLLKTADIPTIKMQDISDQRSSEKHTFGFFLPLPHWETYS